MGKVEWAYLVSRGHPSSLGDHLLSADVNVGAGSGDVVLEPCQHPSIRYMRGAGV